MKQRVLIFGLGYCIAVLIAVITTEFFILLPTIFPDNGNWGSFFRTTRDLQMIFVVGIAYTFVTALPGYIITLSTAHKCNLHGQLFYCAGGVFTAVVAHILLAAFFDWKLLQGTWIVASSLPGGAAGAFAYFHWRQKILSV